MMTFRLRTGFIVILLNSATQLAVAGPNWNAIEDARATKQEHKQAIEKQVTAHESALQKLKAACEKVKDNAGLADACRDIIAADAEISRQ